MGLYEHLFILGKCHKSINSLWELLNGNSDLIAKNADVSVNLTNMINLESTIFFEEFDSYKKFIEPEYHQKMMEIRQIIKPIRNRINQWPDFVKFRNHFIAHPWRDKSNGYKFVLPDLNIYNVPRNYFEISILVNLMNYLFSIISEEFKIEIDEMNIHMYERSPISPPPKNYSLLNEDHIQMARDVNQLLREYRREYVIDVYQYLYE